MATPAGNIVTTALRTARDPQGIATTRAQTLGLVSTAQQVVNGIVEDVVEQSPLTLQPNTTIYQLSSFIPSALNVQTVRDSSNRELSRIDGGADELASIDLQWVTRVTNNPRCWTMIGRDLLCFYPGVYTTTTVNVIDIKITTALAAEGQQTEVANETDQPVTRLTEALLLLKARDLAAFKTSVAILATELKRIKQSRS